MFGGLVGSCTYCTSFIYPIFILSGIEQYKKPSYTYNKYNGCLNPTIYNPMCTNRKYISGAKGAISARAT